MPIGQNPEARSRYLQAVETRDRNPELTFAQMAQLLGYQRSSNARHAWIQGLRILGRENEIPTTRQVRVRTTNGTTTTIEVDDLAGFNPLFGYTFGIEIECVNITRGTCEQVLNVAGIEAHDEDYNHHTRDYWKIVRDGSLTHRNGTAEVVSPVLTGSDGANELRSVMAILRNANAKVNSSCGMHIHIGMNHLTAETQADVILAHQVYNHAFDAFILETRQQNTFCNKRVWSTAQSLAHAWTQGVGGIETSRRWSSDRYYNLNIASYYKYGTFEFRMHHGSLNGKNATAWVALHTAFIQGVADHVLADTHASLLRNFTDEELALACEHRSVVGWTRQDRIDYVVRLMENGRRLPRFMQVRLAQIMVEKLRVAGYLTEQCATYLNHRAGNIPTSRSQEA